VVDLKGKKYGADITSRRARIVGKAMVSGYPVVNLIEDTKLESLETLHIGEGDELYFSVPEKDALLKPVNIRKENGFESDKLALFEFTSSLIGDTGDYYFETHHLNGDTRHLVIGYDRKFIDSLIARLEKTMVKPSGFKLRGWALASGYKNYCWKEGGEMICLLDISDDCTSFCFLRKDIPIALGHITGTLDDPDNGKCISNHYLSDLSTTLRYYRNLLTRDEENLPLSQIIISGASASNGVASLLEENLGVRTTLPAVKKALFSHETSSLAPKYLVSLGLMSD